MPIKIPSPPQSGFLFLSLFLLIGGHSPAPAQPSGGPYGPLHLDYKVPGTVGTVYFVAPDGSATVSGSAPSEPTSLEAAIRRAETGDAIILRGGTYRTGSLIFNQGILMQPYREERPVLKGTEIADEWERLENGLWRTRWEKLFPAEPEDWWRRHRHGHETPLYWFNNDMVFIDGELLRPAGWEGEVEAGSYHIDYENGMIYIGRDPAGRLVEVTAHDNAFTRTTKEAHGKAPDKRGPVIRGIEFTRYAYRAIEIEGRDPDGPADRSTYGKDVVGTVLEHVTITHCSRVAAYLRGDQMVIRHCLISDTETEGLFILASNDVLLERNIIRRNNMQNMKGYYPAAVKIFNQCHGVVCRENLVLEVPNSSGIWYDVGNVDGLFLNNWIEDATDGFFFEISKGAIAAGNVFVNCEKGIRSLNSSGVKAYHNTFHNSMASFERTTRSAQGDHFGWHPATGPDIDERHGHVFYNNLLVADENYHRVLLNVHQVEALCGVLENPQMAVLDHNVYVRRGAFPGEPSFTWGPMEMESCNRDFRSLTGLQALGTSFFKNSREWADYPGQVLQSVPLRNFSLLESFPGADHAGPLPAQIRSLLGWEAERPPHPGAFR